MSDGTNNVGSPAADEPGDRTTPTPVPPQYVPWSTPGSLPISPVEPEPTSEPAPASAPLPDDTFAQPQSGPAEIQAPPPPFAPQYVPPAAAPTFVPQWSPPAPPALPPAWAPASLPPGEHTAPAHAFQPYQHVAPAHAHVSDPTQQQYAPAPAEQFAPNPQAHATGPVYAPPIPRPEDLLVPNRTAVAAAPASWGWRGRMRGLTGGLVKLQAAPAELAARQAIIDIQRGFSRPMTVVVIQPKGGAGKTPTTICLSAAFGAHRGGYVVGWDDNETRGTLAVRVTNPDEQQATVWDLLSDLAAFERFDARVGDLSYYVRPQADAHFDALVSDDNPGNMAQIGESEFQRLHTVLQRFYRMIVVDTGNNVRSPNWQAAVNAADLVVVVSTYQRDVGYSGSWVLDHLAQTGREELARNAVTVLTAADPTTDKTVREQLLAHFNARTRAVVEIPYDPQIAAGGPIRWNALTEPTRNAWVMAGAVVVNALAEHDQRARAARRV